MAAPTVAKVEIHALLAVATLLAGCAGMPSASVCSFSIKGQPIPAAAVMLLEGELADPHPMITGIDVEGIRRSNWSDLQAYVRGNGSVGCRIETATGMEQFEYRHLGCTSRGTHVLRTTMATSGTLVATALHFIRVQSQQRWEDGKWRDQTVLRSVGYFTLGDRDNGEVRMVGDKVVVGPSRHRNQVTEIDVP